MNRTTTEDKHQEILQLNLTVADSNNNITNIITIKEYIKFLKRELNKDRDQLIEGYAEYIDTMYDALLDNNKESFVDNYEIILNKVHEHMFEDIEDNDKAPYCPSDLLRATVTKINNLDRLFMIVFK